MRGEAFPVRETEEAHAVDPSTSRLQPSAQRPGKCIVSHNRQLVDAGEWPGVNSCRVKEGNA